MCYALKFDDLNETVFVEVEGGDFPVGFFDDESVEPEFFVFGMGVPRACRALFVADDGAVDLRGPRVVSRGDLLGHTDLHAGLELGGEVGGGGRISHQFLMIGENDQPIKRKTSWFVSKRGATEGEEGKETGRVKNWARGVNGRRPQTEDNTCLQKQ